MMNPGPALDVDYATADALSTDTVEPWNDVLGLAVFSDGIVTGPLPEAPVARVKVRPLRGGPAIWEIWRAQGPFRDGRIGRVRYRANERFLFGTLAIDAAGDLPSATGQAYDELFRCVEVMNFPHVHRIWNYVPDINREAAGLERYRQFNEARHRAFERHRRELRGNVPAACALGSPPQDGLVVYFIAGTARADAIENPRQIAAYEYPPVHGAYSPKFSRATLESSSPRGTLFVSGTASIVGHQTMHVGDVLAQTRETVTNIKALIDEVNRSADEPRFSPEHLKYKVYLRSPRDLDAVMRELDATLPDATRVIYLNAEVCRRELLIEIEAVGNPAAAGT